MHTHQPLSTLVASLLQRLLVEEELLRGALAHANEMNAALRRGDLPAALAITAQQHASSIALRATSAQRTASAGALAKALGLPADCLKLTALAAKLTDALALEVRTARERLTAVTAELTAIQTRNATLLAHLRSFFRGVLSDITGDDTPARYGPTGSWLSSASGTATQARGTPQ